MYYIIALHIQHPNNFMLRNTLFSTVLPEYSTKYNIYTAISVFINSYYKFLLIQPFFLDRSCKKYLN